MKERCFKIIGSVVRLINAVDDLIERVAGPDLPTIQVTSSSNNAGLTPSSNMNPSGADTSSTTPIDSVWSDPAGNLNYQNGTANKTGTRNDRDSRSCKDEATQDITHRDKDDDNDDGGPGNGRNHPFLRSDNSRSSHSEETTKSTLEIHDNWFGVDDERKQNNQNSMQLYNNAELADNALYKIQAYTKDTDTIRDNSEFEKHDTIMLPYDMETPVMHDISYMQADVIALMPILMGSLSINSGFSYHSTYLHDC